MEQRELLVLRKQREYDKIIVTETATENSVVVVCKKEHNYYVYRYFVMNGEWLVSIDSEETDADKAFASYTGAISFLL